MSRNSEVPTNMFCGMQNNQGFKTLSVASMCCLMVCQSTIKLQRIPSKPLTTR
jgi:hypothetical protein